jgi:MFS family permease
VWWQLRTDTPLVDLRLPLDRLGGPRLALPLGVSTLLFGFVRNSLEELCLAMAVAGLGVGTTFAALPGLITSAVPARETGSAMSVNQVLRYVGFAVRSALSATVLEAASPAWAALPGSAGYGAIAELLASDVETDAAVPAGLTAEELAALHTGLRGALRVLRTRGAGGPAG